MKVARITCNRKGIMISADNCGIRLMFHFWQYLRAFILIAFTTVIFFALRAILDKTLIALIYLIPLGFITASWGFGPGITSAVLTFVTFNYFFIEPYHTFAVHNPSDVVILIVFLIVAVVVSQLVGRAQAGQAIATAREREATQLYELSVALAGLHSDHTIAEILAKHVRATLHSETVELNIRGAQPFVFLLPENDPPARVPDLIIPIQAARGVLGEIRLWRAAPTISSGERRL